MGIGVGKDLLGAGRDMRFWGRGLGGLFLFGPFYPPQAQSDLARVAVYLENLDLDLVADFDDVLRLVNLMIGQLGDVQ